MRLKFIYRINVNMYAGNVFCLAQKSKKKTYFIIYEIVFDVKYIFSNVYLELSTYNIIYLNTEI